MCARAHSSSVAAASPPSLSRSFVALTARPLLAIVAARRCIVGALCKVSCCIGVRKTVQVFLASQ